ncbi:DUF4446 family protein [Lachnobacterium bovis]|uniref:DUF4446 domain-containing protein n=1 Tax=Lachnobacterium bovis TaxID=140626 RepID=A0A1H9UC17_9FIRM|nr:DUF4446 family protein [Lachnobacterium bovis]SES07100.1 Protein of unknown function [Lachnobacterium bovis]
MIEKYLGISTDYVVIGLAALVVLFFIIMIANLVKTSKIEKKYNAFMEGQDGKTLEDTLIKRLDQVDSLIQKNKKNEKDIDTLYKKFGITFQKVGLKKYDAFNEMGGKLSFSLCLLNEVEDGVIINAVHSREGSYTYAKEIIGGNSILELSNEEQESLDIAKGLIKEEAS